MQDRFFKEPILNSPYEYPAKHWELDESGQPTQKINHYRRGDQTANLNAGILTSSPLSRDIPAMFSQSFMGCGQQGVIH